MLQHSFLRGWTLFIVFIFCSETASCQTSVETRSFISHSRLTLSANLDLSASVRIGDLNGDKQLDIVAANGRHWPQANQILLNQGRARFNLIRLLGNDQSTTYATELADLDGDGDLDIVVGNDHAPNSIMLNDGHGHFKKHTEFGGISSVRSITLGDLDNDQDIDIVMTCRKMQNYFFLNDGKANFSAGIAFGTSGDSTIDVAIGDVDGDGFPDLALANRDSQPNYILLSNGESASKKIRFEKRIKIGNERDESRAVALSDINQDGSLDLIVANIDQANEVYFNDGQGGFNLAAKFGKENEKSYSLDVADMNGDGKPDLIIGNVAEPNAVYFNRGKGTSFEAVPFGKQDSSTYGIAVADLDGDGFKDIAVANSGDTNLVYINRPRRN
ncbi:MAG: VCBS repeat-containing protein [Mariniblastus sp.]|nr:VCBS repeat-containing protein [Mariniblastus sp.]